MILLSLKLMMKFYHFNTLDMKESKYKHVYYDRRKRHGKLRKTPWIASIGRLPNGKPYQKWCNTEKEAAISIDNILIKFGKDPVNILKRK